MVNTKIKSNRQKRPLSIVQIYCMFTLPIVYLQSVYGVFVENQNIDHLEIKKFIDSNLCSRSWCLQVQKCTEGNGQYKTDGYLKGICKLLIIELNDVLVNNPIINVNEYRLKSKGSLFSHEQSKKLNEIQIRYMDRFLEYHNKERRISDQHRPRRSIKISSSYYNLNGVPLSFIIDIIKQYEFSDVIFIFDNEHFFSNRDDKTLIRMSTIASLIKQMLQEQKRIGFSYMSSNIILSKFGGSCNNSIIQRLTTKSVFFVISDTNQTRKVISQFACTDQINGDVRWFALRNNNANIQTDKDQMNSVSYQDMEYLPGAKIPIDSNFYFFQVSDSAEKSMIYIFDGYRKVVKSSNDYNQSNNYLRSPLIINYWGIWKEGIGIESIEIPLYERRKNLAGVHLRCATAENPPFNILKPQIGDKEGQIDVDGYFADIWKELQKITNFSYVMTPSVDGAWGSLKDDGTWSGMVGMILRDEVDIAVADFFITLDRSFVVDFSIPLMSSKSNMYIPIPAQAAGLSTFVNPFSHR